jgi:hypothetical protein
MPLIAFIADDSSDETTVVLVDHLLATTGPSPAKSKSTQFALGHSPSPLSRLFVQGK